MDDKKNQNIKQTTALFTDLFNKVKNLYDAHWFLRGTSWSCM